MNDILYTVHVDGTDKKFKKGTPYQELARTYQQEYQHDIVLVFVDGRLQELFKTLETDCELKFVTTADPLGYKSYRRSMSLMLVKAIYDVAGQENIDSVVIHYSVGSGYYFTMKGPMALDQEFIDKVKAQMHRIVDENLPIVKRSVSTSEAVALFHKHHMYDKEKLFNYRRISAVNLYSIAAPPFFRYFSGFYCNTKPGRWQMGRPFFCRVPDVFHTAQPSSVLSPSPTAKCKKQQPHSAFGEAAVLLLENFRLSSS